jgi:hypothetical protein
VADFQRARLELEGLWRSQVNAAQGCYYDAVAKHRQALDDQRQSLRLDRPHAVRNAARAETVARRKYLRILETFKELVLGNNVMTAG